MKSFLKYILSALIILVLILTFLDRPDDKEKLVSNLRSNVIDIFDGEIDTDTQLTYLKSISRALNTGSCTSEDIGIISEGEWISDLRTLVNYRKALENRNYLTNKETLGDREDIKNLEEAARFIEGFNERLWRKSYNRVLLNYESLGIVEVVMSPEDVELVNAPRKFWVETDR